MIVIKTPAGWTPDWLAFPIDPKCPKCEGHGLVNAQGRRGGALHQYRCPDCGEGVLDLAALLGPKDCERPIRTPPGLYSHTDWHDEMCCDGSGKVPQRVALAVETWCDQCESSGWNCPACLGRYKRLRVEYTAQVDAVVPVRTCTDHTAHVCVTAAHWLFLHHPLLAPVNGDTEVDLTHLLSLADWSPGRWAVLTSDVLTIGETYARNIGIPASPDFPVVLRPFDGPIATLDKVLA